jgi:hypothetical protein
VETDVVAVVASEVENAEATAPIAEIAPSALVAKREEAVVASEAPAEPAAAKEQHPLLRPLPSDFKNVQPSCNDSVML